MASERDREIWDDATNAVCQAMQEQKMCNCPDGDCLAAKIDFSPEKIATATRPAPAATDTGLVTVGYMNPHNINTLLDGFVDHGMVWLDQTDHFSEPVVTRSQAEELLAAKDAQIAGWTESGKLWTAEIRELQADNAAKDQLISDQAEQLQSASLVIDDLQTDNAAQAARVNFLERVWKKAENRAEALEAKLAAAEKALEPFANIAGEPWADENGWTDAACQNDRIVDWFGPSAFLAARAVLGGKPS